MQLVPWYLLDSIVGYEGEEGSESSDESSEEEGEEEGEEEEEEEGGEGEKPPTQEDIDRINKALRAERKLRRQAEKDLKALQKVSTESTDTSDKEAKQAREREAAEASKSERLAARFLDTALEGSIVKAATKLKFRDVDDAVTQINREDIDWEQDEDDPSKVTIDGDSVTAAVKALAKKKPYLLATENGAGGGASGGQFGGASGNKPDGLTEEALRSTYPALRRGAR
jgi:hypothetical protein